MSLTEKYRPRRFADIAGQDETVRALESFVGNPTSTAFIFSGDTGTGKTSAALALAAELGCATEHGPFGGVHNLASGEQSADAVRTLAANLWQAPFCGSGWKVWIVNEADRMHPQAEAVWLDVLESLPARTVVVFTTNEAGKLSARFRDRCLSLAFVADRESLEGAAQQVIDRIWKGETGTDDAPDASTLPGIVGNDGRISLRRAAQAVGRVLLATPGAVRIAPAKPVTVGKPVQDWLSHVAAKLGPVPVAVAAEPEPADDSIYALA